VRLLSKYLDLGPANAGFRVVTFTQGDDRDLAARGARAGLDLPTLSRLYVGKPRHGLVLGYMGLTPAALAQSVKALAKLV